MTTTIAVTLGAGVEPGAWITNTAYLLWRDEMRTDWVRLHVGGGTQFHIYLPLVFKGSTGG